MCQLLFWTISVSSLGRLAFSGWVPTGGWSQVEESGTLSLTAALLYQWLVWMVVWNEGHELYVGSRMRGHA